LDVWKKNGGEVIAMTGKAGDDYLAEITEVGRSVLSQNAAAIADYDKLVAASKKYR
jgi:hypothetical protein